MQSIFPGHGRGHIGLGEIRGGTLSSPGFGGTAPGEEAATNALGVRLGEGVLAIVLRRAGVVGGYVGSKSNGSRGLGISLASPLFRLSGRRSLTAVPFGAGPGSHCRTPAT